jgi:hypothetical protein
VGREAEIYRTGSRLSQCEAQPTPRTVRLDGCDPLADDHRQQAVVQTVAVGEAQTGVLALGLEDGSVR